MQARILKGIGGFYYCEDKTGVVYECKAKGGFRKEGIRPLPGDFAEIDILDAQEKIGTIRDILPRKNELIRPAVSNVDNVLIEFAYEDPKPNLNLLDRFILMMSVLDMPLILCFNKCDLVNEADKDKIREIYKDCGYPFLSISTKTGEGMDALREIIANRTTVFAGPSGVGKSSLLNQLMPEAKLKTGEVSEKIRRGKHTTRHTELMPVGDQTYLIDTPGFSSLYVAETEPLSLQNYYREFEPYTGNCRFQPCSHTHEPDCAVKQAVEDGKISESRYKNYGLFYEELSKQRKF